MRCSVVSCYDAILKMVKSQIGASGGILSIYIYIIFIRSDSIPYGFWLF